MDSFDAVIIGAGHNGLAAAIDLTFKGWRVAVVERADVAGGAVKTREVTEPGFRHDLCAMNLSMFAGSAFHARYKEALAEHGLAFVPAPHCFASVFPDGTHLGVGTDVAGTVAGIAALSAEDARAWQAMLDDFGHKAPHIFGLMGAPMPSLASLKVVWRAWRAGGLPLLYDIAKLLLASPRDFLDSHFANDKLKAMMAAWGLHLDFAPDVAGGALFPYLESMTNQLFGMVIGKGGADTIISAMTSLFAAKGGTLLLGAPVAAIEMAGGKASGVRLADGRVLTARRAVISNVNPRVTFEHLVPAEAPVGDYRQAVARFRPGPAAMMIHLAMDDLPDWSAGAALRDFAYVHIAPDMAMMNRVYSEAMAGLLPVEPALVVGQPTTLDPSRAPAGKHVLWVQVRVLPATIRGDAAGAITATDWDTAKEAYADRAMAIIERYAPGMLAKVRSRLVLSPADLEAENPSLIGGDSLSGSHHLAQNFLFRPVAGYSRYKTPVPQLYLCGAGTWPGAGTGAGSGYMLARMLAR
ncbi:NAD(P)/FAD-dependent oxidoreductase [Kaistia dalseonensis]|uniref:Pyridine nucleotide-disulfide oxidoreductase domain-containing protein 2 n=1 Tax=Kaistia dalseonensis TaxID=410840 RepID=A0ABU0H7H3_9HYPH|nr:NAD(P)/FAD-dependent oxidoreductase [Kaistia dalseonensis]MCX5495632.1 NAD(P)/FAD-dependent oxidoreductase [Kaistia dalseonensis]MDQ0438225.1 phytoene dehydrogenase-like protein [Kaistia dalseonensis]